MAPPDPEVLPDRVFSTASFGSICRAASKAEIDPEADGQHRAKMKCRARFPRHMLCYAHVYCARSGRPPYPTAPNVGPALGFPGRGRTPEGQPPELHRQSPKNYTSPDITRLLHQA